MGIVPIGWFRMVQSVGESPTNWGSANACVSGRDPIILDDVAATTLAKLVDDHVCVVPNVVAKPCGSAP